MNEKFIVLSQLLRLSEDCLSLPPKWAGEGVEDNYIPAKYAISNVRRPAFPSSPSPRAPTRGEADDTRIKNSLYSESILLVKNSNSRW
jgi:hypothetical protein